MNPHVSVVIPVYNGERFLSEAIRSVLEQDYPHVEIIVVDDGSTDASATIAGNARGVRVIAIKHGGVSAARNTGVAAATGDYIAFLDADDLWDEPKLGIQVSRLASEPAAGLAMCRHRYTFEGPIPEWFRGPLDGAAAPGFLLTPSLIRRSTWELVGAFNSEMTHGEDGDWLARAKDLGVRIALIEAPLMTYRIHGANASGQATEVRNGILRTLRDSVRRKQMAP